MMSSSNIIKAARFADPSIQEYRYESLGNQVTRSIRVFESHGFVPMMYGAGSESLSLQLQNNPADEGYETGQDENGETRGVFPPGITEDELLQRVQESYDRGFEEGQRQAERGLDNVFKALRGGVSEIFELRRRLLRDCEEDLLKLSILVARKVVQQEIAQDRGILAKVVASAIDGISERDDIVVRLNPEDYRQVTTHKQHNLNNLNAERPISLKPDEAVSFGCCIIETVMGEIDARLETQLEEIYKRLIDERVGPISISHTILNDKEQHAYEES
jgi:flagellar assembly protein FliH